MSTSWFEFFDDALRARSIVAVGDCVTEFLGRTPTRSELTAARRAANRYAAGSDVRAVHVAARAVHVAARNGDRTRTFLLLARDHDDLSDPLLLRDIAAGRRLPGPRQGRGTRNVPQRAESLVTVIAKAARTARTLSAGQLEPAHAAVLARDLEQSLPDLIQFHQHLMAHAVDGRIWSRSTPRSRGDYGYQLGDVEIIDGADTSSADTTQAALEREGYRVIGEWLYDSFSGQIFAEVELEK